jgi:hypothetical protein
MNKYLVYLISIVVLLWILNPILVSQFFKTLEERSKFADTYNIVNSLFAGLGFAVLLYTIIIQRKEIINQVNSVNKTNRLSYLTALLNFYSTEEEKFMDSDREKSLEIRSKIEGILSLIDQELKKSTSNG